ncbi:MAG: efflux RND transporter permease subunit [Thermotogota bacterium]
MKKRKVYEFLSNLVIKNSKFILILTAILTAVFGYLATNLGIDSDLLKIAPQDSDIIQVLNEENQLLQGNDILITAFYLEENSNPVDIAQKYYDEMYEMDSFNGFTETDLSFLLSFGFVSIGNTDVINSISESVEDLLDAVRSANPYDFQTIEYINDTLKKIYTLQDDLSTDQDRNILKSYYAISPDQKIMIMGATFDEPPTNIDFVNEMIPKVQNITDEISNEFGIKTGLTNDYIQSFEANKTVSEDFSLTTIISVFLIILVFILAFGSITTTGIVFAGLIIAMILTLGVAQIFFGQLNIITSFVTAITLGLGIDYGIHIVTRLVSEYKEKEDFSEALTTTYETSFIPLLFGVITTVIVFLTLMLMRLPAFTEMAIMSSFGLVIFFLIMLFFIPAFMYTVRSKIKIGNLVIHVNRLFKKLGYLIPKNGLIIRWLIIPVTIFFVSFGIINVLDFSYTPPGMISEDSPPIKVGQDISNHFGTDTFNSMKYIIRIDEDPDEVAAELLSLGVIDTVESLPEIIENQIGNFSDLKTQIGGLSETLKNPVVVSLLKKYNLYSESIRIVDIASKSNDLYQFTLNILEVLPDNLKSNFFFEKDNKKYMVLEINSSMDIWSNNGLKTFFEALDEKSDRIAGYPKAMYRIMSVVQKRFILPMTLSFTFIFLLTYISRKNLLEALEAFIGLFASSMAAFGIGYFLGIQATFVTMLTFPLIFGIGVDGYIHIFHAIDEDKVHYWHTLKSVTLSFLTSILTFASFQISRGDLLKEFSLNMILSIGLTWIFTVLMIPAFRKNDIIGKWNRKINKNDEKSD